MVVHCHLALSARDRRQRQPLPHRPASARAFTILTEAGEYRLATERALERAQGIVRVAQRTSSTSAEGDQAPASEQLHRPPPSHLIQTANGLEQELLEQRAQIRTAAQVEVQRRLEAEATETVVTAVDAMLPAFDALRELAWKWCKFFAEKIQAPRPLSLRSEVPNFEKCIQAET